MSGFFFSNTSSGAGSLGFHFEDDEPLTFGNTQATPDFSMEWDTGQTPDVLLWSSTNPNTELTWEPAGDETASANIRFFSVDPTTDVSGSTTIRQFAAARFLHTITGNASLNASVNGAQSTIQQITNQNTATITHARANSIVVQNTSTGTITTGEGMSITLRESGSGIFTNGIGINFLKVTNLPTNPFAFNFEGEYITNGSSLRIQDDGTLRYMPISTTTDGITIDSQTLTLATTTSGDVKLSPAGIIDLDGGRKIKRTTVNNAASPYSVLATDYYIEVDSSGGVVTLNLPAAATAGAGTQYIIKDTGNAGTNAITIDGNSSETIDGATTVVLNVSFDSITIVCDGSNWFII